MIADQLLNSNDVSLEPLLFAAQTIRSKVSGMMAWVDGCCGRVGAI